MKKILLGLAFIGMFTFMTPKVANATEPCATVIMTCPDGSQHYVVICDSGDILAWAQLICGLGSQ